VTQDHKAIEQPERNRRQHEQIDCRDAIDMIGQKGPPTLRWLCVPRTSSGMPNVKLGNIGDGGRRELAVK
jgi:hypothetical protein